MKLIEPINVQGSSATKKVKLANSSTSDDADNVFSPAPEIAIKLTQEQKDKFKAGLLKPGKMFRKIWLTPMDRAIANFQRRSEASTLGWKRREETKTKKHKSNQRWHKKQAAKPWQEEQQLRKGNHPSNHYPLLLDYVTYLEAITDRFYLRRLNASSLTAKEKEPFEQCFPNRSSRVQWHGRIVHSWSHLPAKDRNKIFRGDYDLDIKKCHLTIFLALLQKHAPELVEVKDFDVQKTIDSCAELGFDPDCAKELLNATVHGGGKRAYKKTKKEYGNSGLENPPILKFLKEWREYLINNHLIQTPFGEVVTFRNPDEKRNYLFNKNCWERCFYLWENYLKIKLFHNLTESRCHIVYDSYDGCIIKVKDKRMIGLIREEIQSRCDQIGKELGVKIDYKMKEIL